MRDRLIDILQRKPYGHSTYEEFSDYLLENGVIVLPVKAGQWVYVPWRWEDEQGIAAVKVEEINFYTKHNEYMFLIDMESDDECFNQAFGGWKIGDSIGKTVFLTREKAERALKGGASDG